MKTRLFGMLNLEYINIPQMTAQVADQDINPTTLAVCFFHWAFSPHIKRDDPEQNFYCNPVTEHIHLYAMKTELPKFWEGILFNYMMPWTKEGEQKIAKQLDKLPPKQRETAEQSVERFKAVKSNPHPMFHLYNVETLPHFDFANAKPTDPVKSVADLVPPDTIYARIKTTPLETIQEGLQRVYIMLVHHTINNLNHSIVGNTDWLPTDFKTSMEEYATDF